MRDTAERVVRISEQLRALSVQLQWKTFESSSVGDQLQILNGLLNRSLIEDLRNTIDQLSDFLWRYIEAAAAESDPQADYELQTERLRRITELLRLLHQSAYPAQNPSAFMERVTASVDQHLAASEPQKIAQEHHSRAVDRT
jgi:prophage DNA circulation protein